MNDSPAARPPIHFWIIAVVALLWNAVGAFDYVATQLRLETYMSAFSEEQLEYFYSIPTWAVAAWAIAIWSAVLGSLAMLLRLRWAVHLFVISFIALIASSIQSFMLSNGLEIMGAGGAIFSSVIVLIGLFLIGYNRAMLSRGVLR